MIRLYYEEFLNLLVDRQYTDMKKQELESKFPVNFFSAIHPSMAILLDHTSYFKQGSHSPQTNFRMPQMSQMPQMPEPLTVEALPQTPIQNDYQSKFSPTFFIYWFLLTLFYDIFFFFF